MLDTGKEGLHKVGVYFKIVIDVFIYFGKVNILVNMN